MKLLPAITNVPRSGVYLWAALILLLALTGWIYYPGSTGPALLDDYSSVTAIPDLNASPELAWDYIVGNTSGALGRPVSMLSFVLESLLFERSVEFSKLINIGLHLFNGCLVIWLFALLFRHIRVPGALGLAILLGVAWMLSPLFVSTVLYVVQRMAMLAATFMLLALITYCHWRNSIIHGRAHQSLLVVISLMLLLALFSKENAVVLVPIILLLEALWFEFKGADGQPVVASRRAVYAVMMSGALLAAFMLVFAHGWYATGYGSRDFTLNERLLTQARIVWDYVGQLYLPDVSRMGVYHDDVVVSSSLLDPISTLYSVLGWAAVLLGSAVLVRRRFGRYLVFAIACFLVGHGTESTVWPLELYFEHRNYFPAIGLFLFIGILFAYLVQKWPQVKSPLLAYLGVYVLFLATQTSSQVEIFSSRPLFILNTLSAHPDSFRANAALAVELANLGQIEAARKYSAKAFSVSSREREGDYSIRNLALGCLVNKPVDASRFNHLGDQNSVQPFSSVSTLLALVQMLQDDECPRFDRIAFADRLADIFLIEGYPGKGGADIYYSIAVLENALERWDNAYAYTERFLALSPGNKRGLLMKLHFASALGKVQERAAMIATLQSLDEKGELTVRERQTLALYLE
jgi:tetratricopeptide (TPR) repeat protein